jgi:hypothetical protein
MTPLRGAALNAAIWQMKLIEVTIPVFRMGVGWIEPRQWLSARPTMFKAVYSTTSCRCKEVPQIARIALCCVGWLKGARLRCVLVGSGPSGSVAARSVSWGLHPVPRG